LFVILTHGFISALLFYFIGFIFYSSLRRIVYFNSFSYKRVGARLILFSLILFSNFGFPPFLSRMREIYLFFLFFFVKKQERSTFIFILYFYLLFLCLSLYSSFPWKKEMKIDSLKESERGKSRCFLFLFYTKSRFAFLSLNEMPDFMGSIDITNIFHTKVGDKSIVFRIQAFYWFAEKFC